MWGINLEETDLGRGLVDKLSAGDNQTRFDTLVKIKEAFPEVNMNWLVTGRGEILDEVLDEQEVVILDMFRKKVKVKNDSRLTMSFLYKLAWFVKEEEEWDQMDINSKAFELKEGELAEFRATLLLKQRHRRLISEVLQRTPEKTGGLLDMQTRYKEMKKLLGQVNDSIQRIVNLLEQKE